MACIQGCNYPPPPLCWVQRGGLSRIQPWASGFPQEAAIQNIWRTSAIKRQECSKLGRGPNCPSQPQTVPRAHAHALSHPGQDFAVGAPHPGASGVCRRDPAQADFWGALGCEATQELELAAPVICCSLRLAVIPPRLGTFRGFTALRAALLEREDHSHLTRSGRVPLTH